MQRYPVWKPAKTVEVDAGVLEEVGGNELLAQVLARRGINRRNEAEAFLNPDKYVPCTPYELPGLERGVERLVRAIKNGETICVWGDFDVDGQTSTTVLVDTLQRLGGKVHYHIPVRAVESHGVNLPGLKQEIDSGAGLILTCDTGITAHDAVDFAHSHAVDMVITDHHELPRDLPDAYAIINPHLMPDHHPMRGLPGVGVAYQVALALSACFGRVEIAEDQLDLVALGIVADVAEQLQDTRFLLQRGLECLRISSRIGIKILCQNAGVSQDRITEDNIGFMLGPRLNAIGRLADARPVVEFFTTRDETRAVTIASELEALNFRRRLLVEQVFQAALSQVESDPALLKGQALVLSHPEWEAGVVGIVASRLVDLFGKPVVLLCAPAGGIARGSARSVEGVNITAAISACKELLLGYGGHSMAAGLSIALENIPEFRHQLVRAVSELTGVYLPDRTLCLDAELPLARANQGLAESIERLAPFGRGNPGLVFTTRGVTLESHSTFGKSSEHLQLILADQNGDTYRVVWWQGAEMVGDICEGQYDLAYRIHSRDYKGSPQVQIEWVDARPHAATLVTKPVRRGPALIDLRGCPSKLYELQTYLADNPGMLVWREGTRQPAGTDRTKIAAAPVLAIWSTPPGHEELEIVLQTVQPQEVLVFGVNPGLDNPEDFLKTLQGMLKYGINRGVSEYLLTDLAAANGHRIIAIRLGLDYLSARGLITTSYPDANLVLVHPGGATSAASDFKRRLEAILEETAAYRALFQVLPLESLINTPQKTTVSRQI